MTPVPRYRLGRDVITLESTSECAVLQGTRRLRPGFVVELLDTSASVGVSERRAMVESWVLVALGTNGPIYRGRCRWVDVDG